MTLTHRSLWVPEERGIRNVQVTLLDDGLLEQAELVLLALLRNATGPSADGVSVDQGALSLTIVDDEAPLAIPVLSLLWLLVIPITASVIIAVRRLNGPMPS